MALQVVKAQDNKETVETQDNNEVADVFAHEFKEEVKIKFENKYGQLLDNLFIDICYEKLRSTANYDKSRFETLEEAVDKSKKTKEEFFTKIFVKTFDTKLRFVRRVDYLKNQIKKYFNNDKDLISNKIYIKFFAELENVISSLSKTIEKEVDRRKIIADEKKKADIEADIIEIECELEERTKDINVKEYSNKIMTSYDYTNDEGERYVIVKTEMFKTGNVNFKITQENRRHETASFNKIKRFFEGLFKGAKDCLKEIKHKVLTDKQVENYEKTTGLRLYKPMEQAA